MLKLEEDLGERHNDGKLPILDLKVWLEKNEDGVKVKHEFYKKPMASKFTLKKGTAYPKKQNQSSISRRSDEKTKKLFPWNGMGGERNFSNRIC